MNIWLFAIIQAVTSAIITFALIIGILVMDYASSGMAFVWCFVIGMVASLPVAWVIYKNMTRNQ
ncbi:MAG: hypothetical protein ACPGVK_08350 [Halocynthiibacter sp.]